MRLIAWNCRGKFAQNFAHALELDPDVCVFAECSLTVPPRTFDDTRAVTWLAKTPLVGGTRHLGVAARAPWTVESAELITSAPPWVLPVAVRGPVNFTLLATWPVSFRSSPSYTAQLTQVIDDLLPAVEGPVILAGDLNAPIVSSLPAHSKNHRALQSAGLRSAFLTTRHLELADAYRSDDSPALREPTFWQQGRPFHIDHVYLPQTWADCASLTVGDKATWIDTGRSDHVPLILDIHLE